MALAIIKFNLDINPGLAPQIINVSEYDINRQFIISITENGKPFEIPSNVNATIEGTLNQRGFQTVGIISNNTVRFILTEAMTASKGRAWVKIKLVQNNSPISTCGFWLNVDRAGVEAETVIGAPGFEQQIVDAVNNWFALHPPSGGGGLTDDVKQALLDCFENVAWINDDGQTYYDALYAALYPPADLLSISAVFTQGSAVIYDTDSLGTLRQYLVVTATMTDSTTRTVTDYTLSGTLTVGTSTITVSYGGKTTTFSVTVTQRGSDTDYWADGVAYRNIRVIEKQYCRAMDGAMITSQSWCRTDYVNCEGAASISFPPLPQQEHGRVTSNWFFDANHNPVQNIELYQTESVTITVPQNAAYFVVSNEPAAMQTFLNSDIVPHADA